jgi:hypothetical protein
MGTEITGEFVRVDGREYYSINNYDRLPPFFMTLVSPSDHWLFVSSTGGLTLGRINADHALLPYDTVDKIHENIAHTGPITLLRILGGSAGAGALWQPLDLQAQGAHIDRRLSKHVLGTSLLFEEVHRGHGLAFSSSWETSDRYGFVRRCRVTNQSKEPVELELLDGLRNLRPHRCRYLRHDRGDLGSPRAARSAQVRDRVAARSARCRGLSRRRAGRIVSPR